MLALPRWDGPPRLLLDRCELQWLRSFPGGLLSTWAASDGLHARLSEDDGESLGLHGSISICPSKPCIGP